MEHKAMNQPQKLLRINAVVKLTGLSKSYIYDLRNRNLFPNSVRLVEGGASVAWVEAEVIEWIESRIQARNKTV